MYNVYFYVEYLLEEMQQNTNGDCLFFFIFL